MERTVSGVPMFYAFFLPLFLLFNHLQVHAFYGRLGAFSLFHTGQYIFSHMFSEAPVQ